MFPIISILEGELLRGLSDNRMLLYSSSGVLVGIEVVAVSGDVLTACGVAVFDVGELGHRTAQVGCGLGQGEVCCLSHGA